MRGLSRPCRTELDGLGEQDKLVGLTSSSVDKSWANSLEDASPLIVLYPVVRIVPSDVTAQCALDLRILPELVALLVGNHEAHVQFSRSTDDEAVFG